MFDALFEPIAVGRMVVKNRIAMAPMVTNYCGSNGSVTERLKTYHITRAQGGVGVIIVEGSYVHPSGKAFSHQLGIHDDALLDGLKGLVEVIHRNDTRAVIQLCHSGRQTREAVTGMPLMAPSPIPCSVYRETPREMSKVDIRRIIEAFGESARRAKSAGFDAIEIQGAHGNLVNQFISPYTNKRTDEYGGPLENRARFPLEILSEITQTVGADFPVMYRMSAVEHVDEGLTMEDTKVFAGILVDSGIAALHVSGGVCEAAVMIIQPASMPQGIYIDTASAIKKAIKSRVPVAVAGKIKEPAMMNDIIKNGQADIVSLGRALLADPEFPSKVKEGRAHEIRKCIGNNQGCIDMLFKDKAIACTCNFLTGRERRYNLCKKARSRKKVMVIGGGPGGLEAARVAALRGHTVCLYEKSDALGGLLNVAAIPPYQHEIREFTDYLVDQVTKMDIDIKLRQPVNEMLIDSLKTDVVIMATGSSPKIPHIPGIGNDNVSTAEEILRGAPFGNRVAIIGGGSVGCETAEFLVDRHAHVTVVEMTDHIAHTMSPLKRELLVSRMRDKDIEVITGRTVKIIKGDALVMAKDNCLELLDNMDTFVIAVGYMAEQELDHALYQKKIRMYKVGDCITPRTMSEAIAEGFLRAFDI